LIDVLTVKNESDRHGATSGLKREEVDDLIAYLLAIDGRLDPVGQEPEPHDEKGGFRDVRHRVGVPTIGNTAAIESTPGSTSRHNVGGKCAQDPLR
jgi:hypothetical protein